MIKIPFDRCLILTTLEFGQIMDRLESAIYVDPAVRDESSSFLSPRTAFSTPKQERYTGQLRGFKFSATRIVGHKYFHLPTFLLPTIEGSIKALHHGYEISLTVKLHATTCVLLLACLGGLLTTFSLILGNILADKNYQYLTAAQILVPIYIGLVICLYFEARQTIGFFRTLFVKRFVAATKIEVGDRSMWSSDLRFDEIDTAPAEGLQPIDWLRHNLPSFPVRSQRVR
jgi:hypothetical protein